MLQVTGSGTCCEDPEMTLPVTVGTNPIVDFEPTTLPDVNSPSAPLARNTQPSAPPMNDVLNGDAAPPYVADGIYYS